MKAGEFYQSKYSRLRLEIMSIVKGYAMIRYKGAMPIVMRIKYLEEMLNDSFDIVKS